MVEEGAIRTKVPESTPTARELAMVLFRQRKVFTWVACCVLLCAIAYAIFGTHYQANMKLLVRRGRSDVPASAQADAPLDVTRMAITEEDLNSEVELLRDDEVLRKVVEENGLAKRHWLQFLRAGEGHAQQVEHAARRLAKKLRVEAVKKTNLIDVSYSSADPRLSAAVLKSLADAYLEKHTRVHRPGGEVGFFDQQRSESRLQLEEAKGKLLEFGARHGVVAASQQRDLVLQKLSEMDASYRQTHIELAETQERVSELEKLLKSLPERSTTQVRVADNPELQRSLKASLLDLQLKRTQLLTKFEPTHRLVQEIDEQIAQAEAAVSAESTKPLRDETTDKNAHYEWAKAELERAKVQMKSLQARESATAGQEGAYRAMAQQLGEDAITQDDLESTEKAAQETYLLYVRKEEQARMDDALDAHGIVDVAIAEQPTAPALPVWPAWVVLTAGVIAAGTCGTGAALLADSLDPAFRTPDDVVAYLDIPVLASLPVPRRGRLSA